MTRVACSAAENQRGEVRTSAATRGFVGQGGKAGNGDSVPCIAFPCKDYAQDAGDLSPTLRAMNNRNSSPNGGGQVAVSIQDVRNMRKKQNGRGWNDGGVSYTLDAQATQGVAVEEFKRDGVAEDDAPESQPYGTSVRSTTQVRRLTPRECERLQGFPDDWTRISWRGKSEGECPNGHRYRALGNSMAVPCIRWLGMRIAHFDRANLESCIPRVDAFHIAICMKPVEGTYARNALDHGVAGLNVDACRVATGDSLDGGATSSANAVVKHGGFDRPWMHDEEMLARHREKMRSKVEKAQSLGRWPANVIHDGSDDVLREFPHTSSGSAPETGFVRHSDKHRSVFGAFRGNREEPTALHGDSGSAGRFFHDFGSGDD